MASPRPQFYHPAGEIDGALRGIERCIRRAEGVGLVVGPPGTGKSLLLLKLTEQVRDDFDVALLTGASICTRRALWQAILAGIGEPYRGIDEAELRIAVVERIRGLAAAGSGLVILVDEAHTLPTRLIEELRLLTNIPTPLPAVHIVLAGTTRLDELLGAARMESLCQRIAVRGYLEPLDHAETLAYLRTQVTAAGLEWDRLFAAGSDDAVYRVTEGVPRLINQVCDQALVLVAECDRRVTAADIASAWREIQRLPAPTGLASSDEGACLPAEPAAAAPLADLGGEGLGVIEFGGCEDPVTETGLPGGEDGPGQAGDPAGLAGELWGGPDVELVFGGDPFEEFFEQEEPAAERYRVDCPDDFSGCRQVTSHEGQTMGRLLATIERDEEERTAADDEPVPPGRDGPGAAARPAAEIAAGDVAAVGDTDIDDVDMIDDSDMVVIEDDLCEPAEAGGPTVFSVRPSDYRSLFTRLRRSKPN
jgi:general secretion pathway protein A